MCEAENNFVKFKGRNSVKKHLKNEFFECRKRFNRLLRQEKRNHDRSAVIELDNINTSNPRKFWDTLKKLGPKRKKDVPVIIKNDDGELIANEDDVKKKWFNDYRKLYNHVDSDIVFDNKFLEISLTIVNY